MNRAEVRLTPQHKSWRRRAYIRELVIMGTKPSELARMLGISRPAVSQLFSRMDLSANQRIQLQIHSNADIQSLLEELKKFAEKKRTGEETFTRMPRVFEIVSILKRKTEMPRKQLAAILGCSLPTLDTPTKETKQPQKSKLSETGSVVT